MTTTTKRIWPEWALPLGVMLVVLLAQWPLVFNPGYFSHDELQWAHFAAQSRDWSWPGHLWTGVQSFQYRPLTFTAWLWLSRPLFDHPYAFHAVLVALGALNAGLLRCCCADPASAPGSASAAHWRLRWGPTPRTRMAGSPPWPTWSGWDARRRSR